MRVSRSTVVCLALVLLLQAQPAAAYIDPGTGSALFYVISGIVVSIYFGIRGLYHRLVSFFLRIRQREQRCELAIPLRRSALRDRSSCRWPETLVKRGIEPTLFTMYERDSVVRAAAGGSHPSSPSRRAWSGYAYLNNLEADAAGRPPPQLDVMTFRRSKRVKHYAILQHALGECRYMRPFAYDYYDSVLCCGPMLKANLRKMEAIRGLPPKELYATGLPHYEELLRRAREADAARQRDRSCWWRRAGARSACSSPSASTSSQRSRNAIA